MFLYVWLSTFSLALCFELNVFLKDLSGNIIINHVNFNLVLTLFKRIQTNSKNCFIKACSQTGFELKNVIYKEKIYL